MPCGGCFVLIIWSTQWRYLIHKTVDSSIFRSEVPHLSQWLVLILGGVSLGFFLPPMTFHHEKNSGYGIFADAFFAFMEQHTGFWRFSNPRVANRISETTESILETFNCWWREWSLHFCSNQFSYRLTGATATPRFLHPTNPMTSTVLNVFFLFSRAIWVMWTVLKHHFCSTCWS